jgi:FOG: FHA domain
MFRIWLSGGRADVEEFPCTNDEARLGKAEDNLVVLQGWTIAAHHAIIQRDHDGLYIKALESRSAVQVNGQRIQKPYGPLTPEDEIQIGGYRLLVRDDTPFSAVSAQVPVTPSVATPTSAAGSRTGGFRFAALAARTPDFAHGFPQD